MKTNTSPIVRSILGLGLSVFFLVACEERDRDRSGTGATATWLASDNARVLAGDADYESR